MQGLFFIIDPNLFEGDMVLDPEQLESIKKFNKAVPLAASKLKLWPRTIPYDLHELSKLSCCVVYYYYALITLQASYVTSRFIMRKKWRTTHGKYSQELFLKVIVYEVGKNFSINSFSK